MRPKYYHYVKMWGRYRIQRTVHGKKVSFGTYATEEDASKVVSELIKADWDKKQLPQILYKLNIESKIKGE